MTVPPLLELVRRTSDRIAADYDLDAGLDSVIEAITEAGEPSKAVRVAKKELRERARAARAVVDEVEGLRSKVRHLADVLRFSEEGWPERRGLLEAELGQDPLDGLAGWLAEWFSAMSLGRIAAADRLADIDHMPPGAAPLVERCFTTARGLEQRAWHVAEPLLAAGAAGVAVGDRVVPEDAETRHLLGLLLARLALELGRDDDAERCLDAASASGDTPALNALRSRLCRLRGEEERGLKHLNEAKKYGPADLDVVIESIESAGDERLELGLDAARVGVDGLMLLQTVEEDFARLVSEPPSELWVAVGERALREREFELFDRAVERAWLAAPYDDAPLQAVIAELRLSGAELRDLPPEDLAAARTAAGDARLDANELDIAEGHYERAHDVQPDDVVVSLKLADSMIALHALDPLEAGRHMIERGLRMILDVQKAGAITPDNAWCYLAEAAARQRLAEAAGEDESDHLWRAFVAVCRALAYAPYSATRWVELSDIADALNLPLLAVAAAAQAVELDPSEDRSQAQYILALANVGRSAEALEALEGNTGPWEVAAKAYLHLRVGNPQEAVRLLRATELDPTWSWARLTLLWSLAITDRFPEAIAEASALAQMWETRLDEQVGLWPSMWAALTLGEFTRAQQLGRQLMAGAPNPDEELLPAAMARLLSGDHDGGVESISTAHEGMKTTRELDEWRVMLEPFLRVLAAQYRVELPPLDSIAEAIERRRGEIASAPDPAGELREAGTETVDSEVANAAVAFGLTFIRLAANDPKLALDELNSGGLTGPEVDSLRRVLEEQAQARADESSDPAAELLALEAAHAARRGADTEATRALRGLLDTQAANPQWLLLTAANGDPDTLAGLSHALLELADSPEYSSRAFALHAAIMAPSAVEPAAPPEAIQVAMPSVWFDEHPDPLNDHPLFLRYFPEVRMRSAQYVPAVRVNADESLDPDRVQVWVLGELADEARADPAYVYASSDAIALLRPDLADAATPDEGAGMMRLPLDTAEAGGGLLELLVQPAVEVAARFVGRVASREAERVMRAPA